MDQIRVFVKVSGDVFRNPWFLKWAADLGGNTYNVVCVGGGTQIDNEFKRYGFPIKRGPLGREFENPNKHKQIQVARKVLKTNAAELERLLTCYRAYLRVIIPFLEIGGQDSPLDGDEMVRAAYIKYDRLFIVTTEDRVSAKLAKFPKLEFQKIEVLGL